MYGFTSYFVKDLNLFGCRISLPWFLHIWNFLVDVGLYEPLQIVQMTNSFFIMDLS